MAFSFLPLLFILLFYRITEISSLQQHRPSVTLKIALDANGGVVDTDTTTVERFTCPASLDMVHRLRSRCDAILVGRQTVMVDNPSLLVRRQVPQPQQPLRVLLDSHLRLLLDAQQGTQYQVFTDGYPTLVYHHRDSTVAVPPPPPVVLQGIEADPVSGRLLVPDICNDLYSNQNIRHLMVEGGPTTAHAFLQAKCVDYCIVVHARTVHFTKPLASGLTPAILQKQYGLVRLGSYDVSGVDEIECWSIDGTWPSGSVEALEQWP